MPNIVYKYLDEIKQLRGMVDFSIGIEIVKTELTPEGNLEITYGLSPLYKMDLEVHRKLRDRNKTTDE